MEKTWVPIGEALQQMMQRCHELGGGVPNDWHDLSVADLATTMRVAEATDRQACDVLMSLLCENGVLGKPTPLQCYFSAMRCMCALDTLGIFHANEYSRSLYPTPPRWNQKELLQWLLIANWYQRHDTWIKLMAFAASTGRNFYSG